MRFQSYALMVLTLFLTTACVTAPLPGPVTPPLRFVVLGDTAYNGAEDEPVYEELIASINQRSPAFSIHVGDTKGKGSCEDAFYRWRNVFWLQTFGAPELGAVEVTFTSGALAPFSVIPIYGAQNPSMILN